MQYPSIPRTIGDLTIGRIVAGIVIGFLAPVAGVVVGIGLAVASLFVDVVRRSILLNIAAVLIFGAVIAGATGRI